MTCIAHVVTFGCLIQLSPLVSQEVLICIGYAIDLAHAVSKLLESFWLAI